MAQNAAGGRQGGRGNSGGARGKQGERRRGPGDQGRAPGGSKGGPRGAASQGAKGSQGGKRPVEAPDPTEVLRTRLATVLGRLPETQRKVLEYRMGLVDGHPKKLGETATALGISMSEARQIEERAFAHIRDAIPIQHLQKFLGGS